MSALTMTHDCGYSMSGLYPGCRLVWMNIDMNEYDFTGVIFPHVWKVG